MKMYGRSEGIAPPFLTSALDGVKWSASHPVLFTPGEIAHNTHFIGGWVGPEVGLIVTEWQQMKVQLFL
jgi:hypothetical protein